MDFGKKGEKRKGKEGREGDRGEKRSASTGHLDGKQSKGGDEKTNQRRGHSIFLFIVDETTDGFDFFGGKFLVLGIEQGGDEVLRLSLEKGAEEILERGTLG